MKRIVISGLVVLLVVAIVGSFTLAIGKKAAQGPTEAKKVQTEVQTETKRISEAQAIEPKPVMEYNLPDEEIVDIIFDETEMTVSEARALGMRGLGQRRATEKVKIQYPKVVMVKDKERSTKYETFIKSIKFLNEKGDVRSEYQLGGRGEWTGVMISKNKKYLNVHTIINHETREAESVMLDDEGNVLWSVKHNLYQVHPSPNGKYIVGVPTIEWGDAPIYVYNEKGLVKEIKKPTRCWDIDFSEDGSYFAITLEAKIGGKEKYRGDLIVFDDKANELWKKEDLARGISSACEVKIEDDIIMVMTGARGYKIYYFDKSGNLIKEEQGNREMLWRFKKK